MLWDLLEISYCFPWYNFFAYLLVLYGVQKWDSGVAPTPHVNQVSLGNISYMVSSCVNSKHGFCGYLLVFLVA